MNQWRIIALLVVLVPAVQCQAKIPAVLVKKGDTALLKCSLPAEISDRLVWDREGKSGAISIGGVLQGTAASRYAITRKPSSSEEMLSINDVTIADTDIYRCYPLFGDSGPNVVRTNLTIATPPEYIQIQQQDETIYEGLPISTTCISGSSRPAPNILWTITKTNGETAELRGNDTDALHPNGTTTRTSKLYLPADRSMYGATFRCTVVLDLVLFTRSQEINLEMNVAPRNPYITSDGPVVREGTINTFTCVAPDANPTANVTWYRDGRPLNGDVTNTRNVNGTYDAVNTLKVTPKYSDNEAVYVCQVTHPVLQKTLASQSIRLSRQMFVQYAPRITLSQRRDTIWEGMDFDIQCDYHSNPNATRATWYHNDLVISPGQRVAITFDAWKSKISVQNSTRGDNGEYKCEVTNEVGTAMANSSVTAYVLHSPVCSYQQKFQHGVAVGEQVRLSCKVEAVPSSLVFFGWSVNGSDWILMEGERDPTDPLAALAYFNYTVQDQLDYTHINCRAYNGINEMSNPCVYRVREPGPAEAPKDCRIRNLNETGAVIDCQETFDGGYPAHYWVQWEDVSGNFLTLANITQPDFSVFSLETGYNYTMRVCGSNVRFWQIVSCTDTFLLETQGVAAGAVTASLHNNYIIGGVVAGLLLICLVAIIIEVAVLRKRDKKKMEDDRKLFRDVEEMREKKAPWTPEYASYRRSQILTDIDDVAGSPLNQARDYNGGPDPIYDNADNLRGVIAMEVIKSSIRQGERDSYLQTPGLRESSVDPEAEASRILCEMARKSGSNQSVHQAAQTDSVPEVNVVKPGSGRR